MAQLSTHAALDLQPPSSAAGAIRRRPGYLFGPIVDFICLGGSSLILLPLVFLRPAEEYRVPLAVTMLMLSNAINHPHFAHSYQIFYRGFRAKLAGAGYDRDLRLRYVFAGIAMPIVLALGFAAAIASGSARVLGLAGNVMAFVVGWHYVKQGYGMLMVDAALKRLFFDAADKRVLLVNGYVVWMLSWLGVNVALGDRDMWGLTYYALPVPGWLLTLSAAAALVSTGATLLMLARRWRAHGGRLPVNGLVAYGAALYVWLVLVRADPLWFLVVPALHSLQYLVVVWRFEANYQRAKAGEAGTGILAALAARLPVGAQARRMALFVAVGWVLGFVFFWGLPFWLDSIVPYDNAVFGPTMFVFVFWIFINVHHYFMDNVMWRRENPDARAYLFG